MTIPIPTPINETQTKLNIGVLAMFVNGDIFNFPVESIPIVSKDGTRFICIKIYAEMLPTTAPIPNMMDDRTVVRTVTILILLILFIISS